MALLTRTSFGLIASCVLLAPLGCGGGSGGGGGAPPVEITAPELTPQVQTKVQSTLSSFAATSQQVQEQGGLHFSLSDAASCGEGGSELDFGAVADDLQQALSDVADFLQTKVFIAELVEAETGDSVTYRVDPVQLCGDDAQCQADLSANPLRFVTTLRSDDSVQAEVTFGTAHVGTIQLGDTHVGATLDLAQLLVALRSAQYSISGEDLPQSLSGSLAVALDKQSASAFSASFSVKQAVKAQLLDDGRPVDIALAASDPTLGFTVDSAAQSLRMSEDFAALDLGIPGSIICEDQPDCSAQEQSGTFSLHLAGLSSTVIAQGALLDSLTFENVGLGQGTTTIKLGDKTLFTLDLNANSGRRFSLQLTDEGNTVLATFQPALDLKMALMLNALSDTLKMHLPDWLMDEALDISLGGRGTASVRYAKQAQCFSNPTPPPPDDQLQVVDGTLTLTSSTQGQISVGPGMCLLEAQPFDQDQHPFYSLAAGVCQ